MNNKRVVHQRNGITYEERTDFCRPRLLLQWPQATFLGPLPISGPLKVRHPDFSFSLQLESGLSRVMRSLLLKDVALDEARLRSD